MYNSLLLVRRSRAWFMHSGSMLLLGVFLLGGSAPSLAQPITEDYVAGDPSGWTNPNVDSGRPTALNPGRQPNGLIDVNTWQVGRIIDGTEAIDEPDPITEGAGPTVLVYDIRERENIAAGEEWSFFQKAERGFSFQQNQFDTHVIWMEFSSFSNFAAPGAETARLELNFEDAGGTGVSLQNNFSTQGADPRSNQIKAKRAYTDGAGTTLDTLDGNTAIASENLNYGVLRDRGGFFNSRDGQEDDDPNPSDADGSQTVLNTLFDQRAVIRLDDYKNFNFEVEWKTLNPDAGLVDLFNPIASGDGNWRSLRSTGALGSGTEFGEEVDGEPVEGSLIVSSPIQSITTLELTATRRVVGGTEDGGIPDITRANQKINVNQSEPSIPPDDNAFANQQIGLGKMITNVYHIGDINRDGAVTSADITGSDLLANFGESTVEDTSVAIGNQEREVVWSDGDTINNTKITVADALVGVLSNVAGAAPTGPELAYNAANGNLSIQANGASVSGFSFLAADGESFSVSSYDNRGNGLETATSDELGWLNLTASGSSAGSNLVGTINLGNVLPAGLSAGELEDFFTAAFFNIGDGLSKAGSFFAVAGLVGDYNSDGMVDAADYTVWRDAEGLTMALPNDPTGGVVGPAQYNQWRANFGAVSASTSTTIPEPATAATVAFLLAISVGGGRRSPTPRSLGN